MDIEKKYGLSSLFFTSSTTLYPHSVGFSLVSMVDFFILILFDFLLYQW